MKANALWIGWYGFLEAVRNRLFTGLLVLLLPLLAAFWFLDTYQVGFQVKVVKDLGLNLMSVFGLLIVAYLALDQIIPDIERRTIYFILSRSADRSTYLVGRFLGVAGALAFFQATFAGALLLLLRWTAGGWFWEIPLGALVLFFKQAVLVAMILLLTTFTTKIVVIALSVLVYVLGHTLDIFRMLAQKKASLVIGWFVEGLAFFLPDFSLYETRLLIVHEIPIQASGIAVLGLYTILICLFYLHLGGRILARRDL